MATAPIRKVATASARWRSAWSARDAAIRDAFEAGHSQREIATAAGLAHSAIKRILERAAR